MFLLSALVRTFFQLSFSANTELKVEKAKKEQIERNFRHLKSREEVIKRYVRPSLLAEVAMGLDPSHYKPKIIDTNVLFVDMRDFTSLSETLSLDECYSLLNEYFTIINQSIFKHHGEVDKIMGDAVMAVFNDPKECLNACIDMRHSLSQENKKRILGGKLPIRFGTGISSGKVLSANFGSNYKFDRTIVGDIVNIGARLEHLTKEYDLDVLATSDFIEQNPTFLEWRLIDTVYVQGKSFPVKAIEIFRHNSQAVIDYKISTKNDIAAILIHKLDGQFDRAIAGLNTLIDNCPRHSFHPNEIMDSYLIKLREKIMAEKIMAEKINTKRMAS
jgi:class 3 adenylate cyclase